MNKGMGIAALVLAIISIFVPFAGSWLTILVALLAVFAYGEGMGLGIASILINFFHLFFFSPVLWATTAAATEGAQSSGGDTNYLILPWLLIAIQAVALVVLIVLNNRKKAAS